LRNKPGLSITSRLISEPRLVRLLINDCLESEAKYHVGDENTEAKTPTLPGGPSLPSQTKPAAAKSWRDYPDLTRYAAVGEFAKEHGLKGWFDCNSYGGVQVNGVCYMLGSGDPAEGNTDPEDKPKSEKGYQVNGKLATGNAKGKGQNRSRRSRRRPLYISCNSYSRIPQEDKDQVGVPKEGVVVPLATRLSVREDSPRGSKVKADDMLVDDEWVSIPR